MVIEMNILDLIEKNKMKKITKQIDWDHNFPKHIAIMMDGNGRWGTNRGLPRTAGHYAGMNTMKETIRNCREMNVDYLTLYAFSTENWKRPKNEVDYIISLVNEFVNDETMEEMNRNNIKVHFIGDIQKFPADTRQHMKFAEDMTSSNNGMVVNFAMNYGGRSEIIYAIKSIVSEQGKEELSEQEFERHLYTSDCPSPELIIRTSGEKRLSGFLLWQAAQAEIWFTNEMWPSFNKYLLHKAILDYQNRKRVQAK